MAGNNQKKKQKRQGNTRKMDELFGSSDSDSDDMEGLGAGPFDHLTDSTLRLRSFLMDDLFTVSVIYESN